MPQGSPVVRDGRRTWVAWTDLDHDADDFPRIGEAFEQAGGVRRARVGAATALVLSQRALVSFGLAWMRARRTRA